MYAMVVLRGESVGVEYFQRPMSLRIRFIEGAGDTLGYKTVQITLRARSAPHKANASPASYRSLELELVVATWT